MADAAEQEVPLETEIPPIVPAEGDGPVAEPQEPEKEPGGDSPDDVFARKEYRTRKRVEEDLSREREERIRLEERLKAAEDQAKRQPAPAAERIFSYAEVNAAVEAGTITRVDADRYIDERIIPARVKAILAEERAQQERLVPVQKAAQTINEYMTQIPALSDKTSEEFRKVAQEYRTLVSERGYEDNLKTQELALELTYGKLDQVKKRAQMAATTATPRTVPSDAGSGGQSRAPTNGKVDVAKAPEYMRELWDFTNTPKEKREREYRYYLDRQQARK